MTEQAPSTLSHNARLVILADDLSGAADCAVSYARKGCSTVIELTASATTDSQVTVVDTDTRHLASSEAASVCLKAWLRVASPGVKLYKKIDSTLRGNWVDETAALIREAGMAIIAPAMPAMKRATRQGRQYIDQTPVERTEVWRNERREGRADMLDMLGQKQIKTAHLALTTLRESSIVTLTDWLVRQQRNATGAVVCDAETQADLDRIALASQTLEKVFWVGSAGLSQALSQHWNDQPASWPPAIEVRGPVLVVVASMSPISHRQIGHLTHQAGNALKVCRVNIHELLSAAPSAELLEAQAALEQGDDVLVTLAQQAPDATIDGYALSSELARFLGPLIDHLGGVIATGGETAKALLSAGGIDQLRLVDELEPGVALSLAPQGLPVVTKAGGFGQDGSLYQAWRYLVQQRLDDSLADPFCQGH